MNMREIAKICGVSPATVSRAIKGRDPVNQETRRRINDAMARYAYTPRKVRAVRKAEQNNMIGVMASSLEIDFLQIVLRELVRCLRRYNKGIVIIPEEEGRTLRQLRQIPMDGVILLNENISPEIIAGLKQLDLSVVMCAVLSLDKSFPAVHVNDLAAAYDGANYLLDLGHRKIGFVSDFPHLISSGFQRITGCRKAMEDHGIPLEDSFIFSEGLSYDIGYRGAETLLAKHPDMTALFAHSDMTALGVMAALCDRGIRVPADVSVMGFDDIGVGERCRPRMTCVHQPIPGIVEKSVELLIHGIEDPGGQTPSSIIMPHSITIRGSCRRI